MKASFLGTAAFLALAVAPALAAQNEWTTIQRGLYLTHAGDCAACHTTDPSKPMAGNYSLQTPFGTIYTANLTPDEETGIGKWNADDFYRAMTKGREPDGDRLYPAFPYTHFTILKREDSDAIFAYLKTLKPVQQRVRPPEFIWPLNWRFLMRGWNLINFKPHPFQPDPEKSAVWNRGKYLVEGLEHCGMCHTPKDVLGAEEDSKRYSGGQVEGWWAPSLSSDTRDGIGDWSKDDLVSYLKFGRNKKSAAFGPMSDVIEHSTQYLDDQDLEAIATYVKGIPARGDKEPAKLSDDQSKHAQSVGAQIYAAQCSACHAPDGSGVPTMFAPLKGSSVAQSSNPKTVIRAVLEGVRSAPTDKYPTPHSMPPFSWKLTDQEIAAVVNYVRNSFGNRAAGIDADDVHAIRENPSS
ncbi:MAG: c-type cytochrome [Rhizobiaceae bacterium]